MRKSPKYSAELIERAVRMVFEVKDQYPSQWKAIESIAGKIGCSAEALRQWVVDPEQPAFSAQTVPVTNAALACRA